MALKFRRGTTAQQSGSLAYGEPYVNTTLGTLLIGGPDGDIVLGTSGTGSTGNFGAISGSGLDITGNANIAGNLTLGGAITIGDAAADTVNVIASLSSSLIPQTTNAFDLGSATKIWRDLYISTGSIKFVAGTTVVKELSLGTLTALEAATGSSNVSITNLNSFSGSQLTRNTALATITGSLILSASADASKFATLATLTGSNGIRLTNLESTTASLNTSVTNLNSFSSSENGKAATLATYTGSVEGRFTTLATLTGSNSTRLTALEVETANLESFTSSINTTIKTRLNTETVISGSSQVNADTITNFDTNVKDKLNADLVVSGSASNVKTFLSLQNVTNESKATMFASPTFTGTVSGVTATHVGLGNVTNESKATMFTSPTFTGTPVAPTAVANTNSTQIATTAYVQQELTDLIGGASAAFDTLIEISASLAAGDSQLNTLVDGKLSKASNLSDLTDTSAARTNLGVAIGTNVQAFNSTLASVAGGTYSGDDSITTIGTVTAGSVTAILPTGVVSGSSQISLSGFSTTNLSEGTNLYYTDARVKTQLNSNTVVSGSSQINVASTTGDIALGTRTSGDYVASLVAGTNITLSNNSGEGATPTIGLTNNAITIAGTSTSLGGTITAEQIRTAIGTVVTGSSQISLGSASGNIALATQTTGDYVASLVAGTGVTLSNNSGENATPTIAIGQSVATNATPTFGNLTINGSINATGDITAYYTSDKRHKNNIQPITDALLKVSKLNGVTWEWNDDVHEVTKSTPKTGLIAQEVQEVLPEVIKEREDGFLALDYSKMMGLMVEAIKEQQTQIHNLTLEIENLKKVKGL